MSITIIENEIWWAFIDKISYVELARFPLKRLPKKEVKRKQS